MKYYVVADEFTVLGFSLAGVEGAIVSDEDETRAAYQMAVENPDVGVLIITERYADLIRPLVDELLFADRFPLVLEIPDGEGPLAGKPTLKEMVHQAIGVSV